MSDSLIASAWRILKTEGLVVLVGKIVQYLRRSFFIYGNYYICEHIVKEWNETDYMPKIHDFKFEIISTNSQADEIANKGFDDIRERDVFVNVRSCLDKGAIAFCFFVGGELAHIGWVATNEEAKNTFDRLPYHVDFSHGQACTGGTVTLSKYKNKGFMTYGYFKRLEFLRGQGYKTSVNTVAKSNKSSQRAHAKFGLRIYARAHYLKIARWTFWKETYLSDPIDLLSEN